MVNRQPDNIDKLVLFLSKRDGIDKLVKTLQYVSKLANWRFQGHYPELATRAKILETQCGLSRKAFRTGRFLTGYHAMRSSSRPNWTESALLLLGNSGDIVFFFFDHLAFLARIGFLNKEVAGRLCHISAFGECVGYLGFIALCLIDIKRGQAEDARILAQLQQLRGNMLAATELSMTSVISSSESRAPAPSSATAVVRKSVSSSNPSNKSVLGDLRGKQMQCCISEKVEGQSATGDELKKLEAALSALRMQRLFHYLTIFANVADLIIALAEVEPNPVCNHPFVLGVSGLVSAWSGWYKLWPP